jgi:hypothetical protein
MSPTANLFIECAREVAKSVASCGCGNTSGLTKSNT